MATTSPILIELDTRRRASLARLAQHDRYLVDVSDDGVITLIPAIVRSELEDQIRATPGLSDSIEEISARPDSAFRPYQRRT